MRAGILSGIGTAILAMVSAGAAAAQSPCDNDAGATAAGFACAMLESHNAVRAQVGVPPLQWSETLARHARQWAQALLRAGEFRHRPDSPYGENLFMITGASAAPADVVRDWASESRYYDARAGRCRAECGHFTQIVWRATTGLGCGVARGRGREIWVCNYDPPGNVVGERPF